MAEPAADAPSPASGDDVQADEAWFSPTALTQPAGTATISDHEIVFGTVTYAPVRRLQLTLRGTLPVFGLDQWLAALTAKLHVIDAEHAHLSLYGGGGFSHGFPNGGQRERFLSVGAVVSFCGVACRSLASFYVLVNPTRASVDGSLVRYFYGANVLVGVGGHVKLLAEVNLIGEDLAGGRSGEDDLIGVVGVRVYSGPFAVTAGPMIIYGGRNPEISESRDELLFFAALSFAGRFGGP